jgi:hypothetical protein
MATDDHMEAPNRGSFRRWLADQKTAIIVGTMMLVIGSFLSFVFQIPAAIWGSILENHKNRIVTAVKADKEFKNSIVSELVEATKPIQDGIAEVKNSIRKLDQDLDKRLSKSEQDVEKRLTKAETNIEWLKDQSRRTKASAAFGISNPNIQKISAGSPSFRNRIKEGDVLVDVVFTIEAVDQRIRFSSQATVYENGKLVIKFPPRTHTVGVGERATIVHRVTNADAATGRPLRVFTTKPIILAVLEKAQMGSMWLLAPRRWPTILRANLLFTPTRIQNY